MAITIDWTTKVIFVPRLDIPLVNAVPEERELDLDDFRLELKSIEESVDGITFLDTHVHVAPISVGGVTLARVLEIVNGYSVEFESGVYRVTLINANSNVSDVSVHNQVSVNSANSAGLTDQGAIAADVASLKTKVSELWEVHGLDATTPLEVTDTSRDTANVSQTIADDGTTTTVTRS